MTRVSGEEALDGPADPVARDGSALGSRADTKPSSADRDGRETSSEMSQVSAHRQLIKSISKTLETYLLVQI